MIFDLWLLGQVAGFAEILIPAVHAGSSIMPGKVNPSLAECLNMVCFNIIGNDVSVAMATQAGQFELNVMLPGMLKCILDSTDMLKNFLPIFAANMVDGIEANKDRLESVHREKPRISHTVKPIYWLSKSSRNIQGIARDQQEHSGVGSKQRIDDKGSA